MQPFVQLQQLLLLALHQPRHGNARPAADDIRDLLLGDLLAQQTSRRAFLLGIRLLRPQLLLQLPELTIAEFGNPVEVVLVLGLRDVGLDRVNPAPQLADARDGPLLRLVRISCFTPTRLTFMSLTRSEGVV